MKGDSDSTAIIIVRSTLIAIAITACTWLAVGYFFTYFLQLPSR